MDIIQRTMEIFQGLVQRIKDIADVLVYAYLPSTAEMKSSRGLFWIFNW